ncbi:MAG: response regulator [Deltaproteobacteria bacterium]|nr:response regulator [Deltaproteobacteria bacterium]
MANKIYDLKTTKRDREPKNIKIKDIHDGRPSDITHRSMKAKKILIVDDDAGMRDMLLSALSYLGIDAVAAHSGPEALEMFSKNHFTLVITDLQMPGMDGWALASRIKKALPEMPVIMMTAQAKSHVIKDLEESCFDSALFKPFKLEQLQQEIKRLLGNTPIKKSH